MANTYTQLYIHCVFAVKYRAAMLQAEWDERLRLYITAVAKYILNQQEHHRKTTFPEEYKGMLQKFGIEYDER